MLLSRNLIFLSRLTPLRTKVEDIILQTPSLRTGVWKSINQRKKLVEKISSFVDRKQDFWKFLTRLVVTSHKSLLNYYKLMWNANFEVETLVAYLETIFPSNFIALPSKSAEFRQHNEITTTPSRSIHSRENCEFSSLYSQHIEKSLKMFFFFAIEKKLEHKNFWQNFWLLFSGHKTNFHLNSTTLC